MALKQRLWWYAPLALMLAASIPFAGAMIVSPRIESAPIPTDEPFISSMISVLDRTVIPEPVLRVPGEGAFQFDRDTSVVALGDAAPIGEYFVNTFRPLTGLSLPLTGWGNIVLVVEPGHPDGGYDLHVTFEYVMLSANDAAGLFAGVQTLRQLVAPKTPTTSGYAIAATTISDYPRFSYRGAMLDVARHFFPVESVKRYIDDIAMLKMNVLHLHLSDDQGWRIEIKGWPRLTEVGGSRQVGGGAGGFYTQEQYTEIVKYAASRYITIVPEIDMPGHTNAALASYAELNCSGYARSLYYGTSVGFSSLCVDKEVTWRFLDDVLGQLAALTPGPWIHIGGDESDATSFRNYKSFITRAAALVHAHGKTVVGWHDIAWAPGLPPGTVGEYWDFTTPRVDSPTLAQRIVGNGGKLIMAPANVAYLDQKYDLSERIGTTWAQAPTTIQESYGWDPADVLPGHGDESILGVEAPLWTETVHTMADIEYMAFPRIVAIAEIGWTPRADREWGDFASRLATFGLYMTADGIGFKPTPGVPWL